MKTVEQQNICEYTYDYLNYPHQHFLPSNFMIFAKLYILMKIVGRYYEIFALSQDNKAKNL